MHLVPLPILRDAAGRDALELSLIEPNLMRVTVSVTQLWVAHSSTS
jgi:hypothetical protein